MGRGIRKGYFELASPQPQLLLSIAISAVNFLMVNSRFWILSTTQIHNQHFVTWPEDLHHARHPTERICQGTSDLLTQRSAQSLIHRYTYIGPRRPQDNRPAHSLSNLRQIPHRDPLRRYQFLRHPPNPRQISTPTAVPMDFRHGIRRHHPRHSYSLQDTQIQSR